MTAHKWIYSFLFALQAAFIALPESSEAADIVSVIVTDTQDESIGDSTAADLYKMQSLVSKIAKNTDLKPRQVVLKDRNAIPSKMLSSLKSLKVNRDDVVIFYFSGHGYRTPSKGDSLWPNLYFSLRDEGVEYEKVVSILQNKNPRLLITMADVCNNVISESQAPMLVRSLFKRVNEDTVIQNYRRLFLETSGIIRVTGAKKGEFAWATPVGGTFTLAFIKSLETEVNSSEPADWTVLLDRVSIELHRDDQHPVYVVETSSR